MLGRDVHDDGFFRPGRAALAKTEADIPGPRPWGFGPEPEMVLTEPDLVGEQGHLRSGIQPGPFGVAVDR